MIVLPTAFNEVDRVVLSADGRIAVSRRGDMGDWVTDVWGVGNRQLLASALPGSEIAFDPRTHDLIRLIPESGVALGATATPSHLEMEDPLRALALTADGGSLFLSTRAGDLLDRRPDRPSKLLRVPRQTDGSWGQPLTLHERGFSHAPLLVSADNSWLYCIELPIYPVSVSTPPGTRPRRGSPLLQQFDTTTGRCVRETPLRFGIRNMRLLGAMLVVLEHDGIELFPVENPLAVSRISSSDSDDAVAAFAADPHGRFLLTASGSSVSVWDPKTWTVAKTYDWKAGAITCLAVAPDGLTAAAGTATGKVVVWDVE